MECYVFFLFIGVRGPISITARFFYSLKPRQTMVKRKRDDNDTTEKQNGRISSIALCIAQGGLVKHLRRSQRLKQKDDGTYKEQIQLPSPEASGNEERTGLRNW